MIFYFFFSVRLVSATPGNWANKPEIITTNNRVLLHIAKALPTTRCVLHVHLCVPPRFGPRVTIFFLFHSVRPNRKLLYRRRFARIRQCDFLFFSCDSHYFSTREIVNIDKSHTSPTPRRLNATYSNAISDVLKDNIPSGYRLLTTRLQARGIG